MNNRIRSNYLIQMYFRDCWQSLFCARKFPLAYLWKYVHNSQGWDRNEDYEVFSNFFFQLSSWKRRVYTKLPFCQVHTVGLLTFTCIFFQILDHFIWYHWFQGFSPILSQTWCLMVYFYNELRFYASHQWQIVFDL